MNTVLADLTKLVGRQTDLYRQLLDILRSEHQILLSASVEDLYVNNKKKDVVVLQIKLLDESSSQLIRSICRRLTNSASAETLPDLIPLLPEPHRAHVEADYSLLRSLAQSVKDINRDNEQLLHGALRVIQSSISFLVGCASRGKPVYQNSGRFRTEAMVGPLLSEEA
jgi:flagellar biosynthesis/type III secretory pathway chaperone